MAKRNKSDQPTLIESEWAPFDVLSKIIQKFDELEPGDSLLVSLERVPADKNTATTRTKMRLPQFSIGDPD